MSSGIAPPQSLPQDVALVAPPTEYEGFIDHRLRQTRRRVKGVDIAGGLVTLAIGVLGYLFAGRAGRPLAGGRRVGVLGAAAAVAGTGRRGGDLLRPPPAAAAAAPHQSGLRRRHDREEPAVAEEQPDQFPAAPRPARGSGRAGLSGDGVSRRGRSVESPRSKWRSIGRGWSAWAACWPRWWRCSASTWSCRRRVRFRSAARVLWPWSAVEAPTRVTIRDVQPGRHDGLPRRVGRRLGRSRRPAGRRAALVGLQHGRRADRRSGRFR